MAIVTLRQMLRKHLPGSVERTPHVVRVTEMSRHLSREELHRIPIHICDTSHREGQSLGHKDRLVSLIFMASDFAVARPGYAPVRSLQDVVMRSKTDD
jgi:hypothetical protein